MNSEERPRHMDNFEESNNGCMKGCAVGCGVIIIVVVGLFYWGYCSLIYSPMPLRALANFLNNDPNVEIVGVDGSIASGFSVERVRVRQDNGNMNKIDNAGIHYDYGDDYLELIDMYVDRAHIFYDKVSSETSVTTDSGATRSKSHSNTDVGDELESFKITKIDLKEITFEDSDTGHKTTFDKIVVDSFVVADDHASLKEFTVESTYCNISVLPFESPDLVKDKYSFSASIDEALNPCILKDISALGTVVMNDNEQQDGKLMAFDGTVLCRWVKGQSLLKVAGFNPSDYFSDLFCVQKINLELAGNSDGITNVGVANFSIGSHIFEVDRSIFDDTKKHSELTATCVEESVTYSLRMYKNNDGEFHPTVELRSEPAMDVTDILGMLIFDKRYNELTTGQKERVNMQRAFCR